MIDELLLINNLLQSATFQLAESDIIKFKKMSHFSYGDNPIIYSVNFEGLSLSIIILDETTICGEQIEIIDFNLVKHDWIRLKKELIIESFTDNLTDSIYGDDNEIVVLLKNGVNIYYNKDGGKFLLSKITGKHESSRKLVKDALNRII